MRIQRCSEEFSRWCNDYFSRNFLAYNRSTTFIIKGFPGAQGFPLYEGWGRVVYCMHHSLFFLQRWCFHGSNPWPSGHKGATLPLLPRGAFIIRNKIGPEIALLHSINLVTVSSDSHNAISIWRERSCNAKMQVQEIMKFQPNFDKCTGKHGYGATNSLPKYCVEFFYYFRRCPQKGLSSQMKLQMQKTETS